MRLGDLIAQLRREPNRDRVVAYGFGDPHSYRGYYDQLAFEPRHGVSVESMLRAAESSLGATFTGYKGGEYRMTASTETWLATWGDCNEDNEPLSAGQVADMLATELTESEKAAAVSPPPADDDPFRPLTAQQLGLCGPRSDDPRVGPDAARHTPPPVGDQAARVEAVVSQIRWAAALDVPAGSKTGAALTVEDCAALLAEYDRRGTELVEAQRARVSWSKSLRRQEIRVTALSGLLRGMARRATSLRSTGEAEIERARVASRQVAEWRKAELAERTRLRDEIDTLRGEKPQAAAVLDRMRAHAGEIAQLRSALDLSWIGQAEAEAKVAAARALHYPTGPACSICPGESSLEQSACPHEDRWCKRCEIGGWPCATADALDGPTDPGLSPTPNEAQTSGGPAGRRVVAAACRVVQAWTAERMGHGAMPDGPFSDLAEALEVLGDTRPAVGPAEAAEPARDGDSDEVECARCAYRVVPGCPDCDPGPVAEAGAPEPDADDNKLITVRETWFVDKVRHWFDEPLNRDSAQSCSDVAISALRWAARGVDQSAGSVSTTPDEPAALVAAARLVLAEWSRMHPSGYLAMYPVMDALRAAVAAPHVEPAPAPSALALIDDLLRPWAYGYPVNPGYAGRAAQYVSVETLAGWNARRAALASAATPREELALIGTWADPEFRAHQDHKHTVDGCGFCPSEEDR